MLITNIRIQKVHGPETLVAVASITLDDIMAVHDIKIIYKNEKYFMAMPSKKVKDYFLDIVHPIHSEAREVFEKLLIVGTQVLLEANQEKMDFQIKESSLTSDFYSLSLHDYSIV